MDKLELLLPTLKFPKCVGNAGSKKNGGRQNMTIDNIPPTILFFGIRRDINTGNWNLSKGDKLYPEVANLLHQIAKENFSEYQYQYVQINKNVKCKMHLDKSNIGDSYIFTLGTFNDGQLLTTDEKIEIDIYKKPYKFNGAKVLHGTGNYTGDRYCVIYYNSKYKIERYKNCDYLPIAFDILKPEVNSDYLTINEIFRKNIYKVDNFFKKGEKWIDIGANIGAFALACYNADVTVSCYEPAPRNIKKLKELQSKIKFTLVEAAVSNKDGNAELYLEKNGEWRHCLNVIRRRESVGVHLVAAETLEEVDGIKIDAEGSEIDIIYNLKNFPKHLIFEYDGDHNKNHKTYNKLMEFLETKYKDIVSAMGARIWKDLNFFPRGILIICTEKKINF